MPGEAISSGTEPLSPACHVVPMPRYAAVTSRRKSTRGCARAMCRTSIAEPTRLRPQCSHASSIDTTAMRVAARAGEPAARATIPNRRSTAGAVDTRNPVSTTSAICMAKGLSAQKPPPQATTTSRGVAPMANAPANVTPVSSTAMANALGT